jgi:hypothetical protein
MAEQPEMDSPTDNSVEQKPVEQKQYKSERDAVEDMKNLLGLQEKSSQPEATRNHEIESEVSSKEEVNSQENTDELGEDAELVDLLEEETTETTEDFIELNGEKIPLEELKKDRLRQKDYTQKTQKLSDERKEFDQMRNQVLQEGEVAKQQRELFRQKLEQLEKTLSQVDTQNVDLERLYQEDPAEYVRQKALIDKRNDDLKRVAEEKARLDNIKQQEQDQIYNQYLVNERQKLSEKLPIYADKDKGETYRQNLVNFAKERGFTNEEIGLLVDHRSVLLLADAFQYHKLKQSNLKKKQVNKAPRVLSTNNKTKVDPSSNSKKFNSQMDRLKKSGKVNDASSVFLEMINNKAI